LLPNMARSAPFLKREEINESSDFVVRSRETARPTGEPTIDAIRTRAYEIYLSRGGAPGHEGDDWAQAERELRAQRSRPGSK